MKKLIALVILIGLISLVPTPPIGNRASADRDKPPSIAQSTLKSRITHVEALQSSPTTTMVESTTPIQTPVVGIPTYPTEPTTHEELTESAGISQNDYTYVDYIISHESGWNPDATNISSGAHGLPQALPYSKTGCGWDDGVCQLEWANSYAVSRYGSWYNAYNFWINNHYW